MLYDEKQLPELRYLKNRHSSNKTYVDYENVILAKSLSPHMFETDHMLEFLAKLQPMVALMFDKFNIVKNFRNYMVDKYYYKHVG